MTDLPSFYDPQFDSCACGAQWSIGPSLTMNQYVGDSGAYRAEQARATTAEALAKELANELSGLLDAYSAYFPPGNPWGDQARALLARTRPSGGEAGGEQSQ